MASTWRQNGFSIVSLDRQIIPPNSEASIPAPPGRYLSATPHRHNSKQESNSERLQGRLPRPSAEFIQGHAWLADGLDRPVYSLACCAKEIGRLIEGRFGKRVSPPVGSV
jgi:hypothetical protein